MADTTFVDETTLIEADWLNAVNDTVYSGLGGNVTPASIKLYLGLDDSQIDAAVADAVAAQVAAEQAAVEADQSADLAESYANMAQGVLDDVQEAALASGIDHFKPDNATMVADRAQYSTGEKILVFIDENYFNYLTVYEFNGVDETLLGAFYLPKTLPEREVQLGSDIVGGVATLTQAFTPGSLDVYLNGTRLVEGVQYTETGSNQVTWLVTPASDDRIVYRYGSITGPSVVTRANTEAKSGADISGGEFALSIKYTPSNDGRNLAVYWNGSRQTKGNAYDEDPSGEKVIWNVGITPTDTLLFVGGEIFSTALEDVAITDSERNQSLRTTLTDLFDLLESPTYTIQGIVGNTDTLDLGDIEKYLRYTAAGAITVTVPNDTTTDFDVGTSLTIRNQSSDDSQLTIAAEGGVTLNGTVAVAVGTTAVIVKVAANEWDIS